MTGGTQANPSPQEQNNMANQLGVEMTYLNPEDRNILMKGMILRRLVNGSPLKKSQLDTGIGQDMIELKKRFSTFDFEDYVGCDLDAFYTGMTVAELINQREVDDDLLYERGGRADEFDASLTDDMEWMVETLPMSTRGFYDDLKSQPEREVVVDVDEFNDAHSGGKKRMVVDHSKQRQDLRDHQLRAGPANKK